MGDASYCVALSTASPWVPPLPSLWGEEDSSSHSSGAQCVMALFGCLQGCSVGGSSTLFLGCMCGIKRMRRAFWSNLVPAPVPVVDVLWVQAGNCSALYYFCCCGTEAWWVDDPLSLPVVAFLKAAVTVSDVVCPQAVLLGQYTSSSETVPLAPVSCRHTQEEHLSARELWLVPV